MQSRFTAAGDYCIFKFLWCSLDEKRFFLSEKHDFHDFSRVVRTRPEILIRQYPSIIKLTNIRAQ